MPQPDSRVAILGGGCAGLSLAVRLAERRIPATVIEPRTVYRDDRTWSFWRTGRDPFAGCVRARWSAWAVEREGETLIRRSERLRYETLPAIRFYDKAVALCRRSDTTRLHRGTCAVGEPGRDRHGNWVVETDRGAVTARYLVDTRPCAERPRFAQHFLGREVRVDGAAFDPGRVTLMAFGPPRPDRVDFVYVLPYAADRALVEVTSFAAEPPGEAELEAWLSGEIAARAGGRSVETVRTERGAIPMAVEPRAWRRAYTAPRRARAGLRGGAARPSTGYAFQRIQRLADVMAERIGAGAEDIVAQPDGAATRAMDALFLRVLRRHPQRGPALFAALFRHPSADRLERFLSDSVAPADRLAVVASLPPLLFLRELAAP